MDSLLTSAGNTMCGTGDGTVSILASPPRRKEPTRTSMACGERTALVSADPPVGAIVDCTFEIVFLDVGMQTYAFTFSRYAAETLHSFAQCDTSPTPSLESPVMRRTVCVRYRSFVISQVTKGGMLFSLGLS